MELAKTDNKVKRRDASNVAKLQEGDIIWSNKYDCPEGYMFNSDVIHLCVVKPSWYFIILVFHFSSFLLQLIKIVFVVLLILYIF